MLRTNLKTINRRILPRLVGVRQFSRSHLAHQGQVFKMPAMSPTMTEGGVVSWKFKPGDNFSAGDVLLEVETDKATIDVEAQDDGIMWEIIINDGANGIPVGKPIALLAEPGDDLSTLERPDLEAEDASQKPEPKKEASKPPAESKSEPKPVKPEPTPKSSAADSDSVFVKANPEQQLLPSVELLLHQNHISTEDAYSKIPASGPKGRILKGDVLAYLGSIDKESVSKVSQFIKSKQHLDLSNIIVKQPESPKPETAAAAESVEKPKPKNIITVKFTSDLHDITKSEFQVNLQQAINSSIKFTYGSKFPQYSQSPTAFGGESLDDIFDDLMAAPVTKDRFQVSDISYNFHSATGPAVAVDPFDDLLGVAATPVKGPATFAEVEFKIKYDEKLTDAKQFVELFQDSLFSQIPSNKLIITN